MRKFILAILLASGCAQPALADSTTVFSDGTIVHEKKEGLPTVCVVNMHLKEAICWDATSVMSKRGHAILYNGNIREPHKKPKKKAREWSS